MFSFYKNALMTFDIRKIFFFLHAEREKKMFYYFKVFVICCCFSSSAWHVLFEDSEYCHVGCQIPLRMYNCLPWHLLSLKSKSLKINIDWRENQIGKEVFHVDKTIKTFFSVWKSLFLRFAHSIRIYQQFSSEEWKYLAWFFF